MHMKVLGPDHPETATSLFSLGEILIEEKRTSEAEGLFKSAANPSACALRTISPKSPWSLRGLAHVEAFRRNFAEADQLFTRDVEIAAASMGELKYDVIKLRKEHDDFRRERVCNRSSGRGTAAVRMLFVSAFLISIPRLRAPGICRGPPSRHNRLIPPHLVGTRLHRRRARLGDPAAASRSGRGDPLEAPRAGPCSRTSRRRRSPIAAAAMPASRGSGR